MVKPLAFKGEKVKKRKRTHKENEKADNAPAAKQRAITDGAEADEDENWVSADALTDITGPVLVVLSSTPPSSLSVDQLGRVFAQPIENMVEGSPESAEPHDVRQVWIATRVVGSETEFVFKGHHGRYLGCDKFGVLEAGREAMGPEETFRFQPVEGVSGQFEVKTKHGKFLSVDLEREKDKVEVRGDAEVEGEGTRVRIRMQARFKPKHKVEKAEKVRAKISRKELESEVGRKLEDEEVKRLKRARREGDYHEVMLDVKVKGKHDKFA
ncbi:actin-crosslinking protein [Teratosphaeria destructans]|uniref:Actin-crosslinking protein n=1 Tax=Teratosphaeria destructans TaxID=418781 RepID=A0A9W7SPM5_9PEZI|nr:actin-crosslinking protein [Teratosphaeria destructans]